MIIRFPLNSTSDIRTVRIENNEISAEVSSLPKAAQKMLAQADMALGNGDGFVSPQEANKQFQETRSHLTDMSGASLWTRLFPGKEIKRRSAELEAAQASYIHFLGDVGKLLHGQKIEPAERASILAGAVKLLTDASKAVSELPGAPDKRSMEDGSMDPGTLRRYDYTPFRRDGLAAKGHSAAVYETAQEALKTAAAALDQGGALLERNQMRALQESFEGAAVAQESHGGGGGSYYYGYTERGMTKNQALDFLSRASALLNQGLAPR